MSSGEESGDYTDDDASWESGDESETDRASGGSETGSEQSGSGSEWGTGDETEHSESEYSEYSTGDEGETESETESESEGETEYASVTPSRGMGGGMSNPMKQRGMAQTSHKGLVRTIFIYRNGDAFFPARKVVFGYKIRTFIYLLEWITEEIHPPFGAVRKLFDLSTGKEVNKLQQIEDQGEYVAGPGHKKFAKLQYASIVDYATKQREYRPPDLSKMKMKMKQVAGRNEVEHPMTLYILANRDKDGIPTKVILMRRDRVHGMQHILDIITKKLGYMKLPANAKKLFDLTTRKPLHKMKDLYDHGHFVAIDRIEAVRLPPFDVVNGELIRRSDRDGPRFKNKPIMFDRRITGKTDVGERRLDKLLKMGFASDVGRVQLIARPPPKFLPGLGRHTGMRRISEMRKGSGSKKKKKRDGAYADDPDVTGAGASSGLSAGSSAEDKVIWDYIHYDLIDQLTVPVVEEALKEHQQKLFKLLNDYVVARATDLKGHMSAVPTTRVASQHFAKHKPALPALDAPAADDRPLLPKKKRRPGSGSSKASRASRVSRKSRASKASRASKLSRAAKTLSARDGGATELEREGTTFLGDDGPQSPEAPALEEAKPEEEEPPAPKKAEEPAPQLLFGGPLNRESVDQLTTVIVDYMLRPTADYFAEDASEADQETAGRFARVMTMAICGELSHWEDDPLSLVALVIALDQFPRTIYKGTKREYEGEPMLQKVLIRAVEETGVIQDVVPMHMWFCCLALSHQEDLHAQKLGTQLWASVKPRFAAGDPIHKYERAFNNNHKLIEKFGRFPQRNERLGRTCTDEEAYFLEVRDKRAAKRVASTVSVSITDADAKAKRKSRISRMFSKAKKPSGE